MRRQRGVVLLLALSLSLLLGLLAAQVLREAQARQGLASERLAVAQAFEHAEAGLAEASDWGVDGWPAPCQACLPPSIPPAAPGPPWQATATSFVLLQHLGPSDRAAGLPADESVQLLRVTAISQQPRARQVLEAVYARDAAGGMHRVSWRQRLPEG